MPDSIKPGIQVSNFKKYKLGEIREFHPVDGDFYMVMFEEGRFISTPYRDIAQRVSALAVNAAKERKI